MVFKSLICGFCFRQEKRIAGTDETLMNTNETEVFASFGKHRYQTLHEIPRNRENPLHT